MKDATLLQIRPCPVAPHRVLTVDRTGLWELWDHRLGKRQPLPSLDRVRWRGQALIGLDRQGSLLREDGWAWAQVAESRGRVHTALTALAGGWIAAADQQGQLTLYDGDLAVQRFALSGWANDLAGAPAGAWLAVASETGRGSVVDVETGERLASRTACNELAGAVGWDPTGRWAVAEGYSSLVLLDPTTRTGHALEARMSRVANGFTDQLPATFAFSPDGEQLALTGTDDHTLVSPSSHWRPRRLDTPGWQHGVAWEGRDSLWLAGPQRLRRIASLDGQTLEVLETRGAPSRVVRTGDWLYADLQAPERGPFEGDALAAFERDEGAWLDRSIRR